MGSKKAGCTYETYPAKLLMIGYSTIAGHESAPQLIEQEGTIVLEEKHFVPYDITAMFVPKAWLNLYDEEDIFGIGTVVGPEPGVPAFGRVWVREEESYESAVRALIDDAESYMLDGYQSQEQLGLMIETLAEKL